MPPTGTQETTFMQKWPLSHLLLLLLLSLLFPGKRDTVWGRRVNETVRTAGPEG